MKSTEESPRKKTKKKIINLDTDRFMRPSQEMVFSHIWHNWETTMLIASRRMGKSRLGVLISLFMMYQAIGALRDLYPTFVSKVIEEHNKTYWEPLGRSYNALLLLPGAAQGDVVIRTELEASKISLQKHFPKLSAVPWHYANKVLTLTWKGKKATFSHFGIDVGSEKRRGAAADFVVLDEVASHNPDTIRTVISPMLSDTAGVKFLIGTAAANHNLKVIKQEVQSSEFGKVFTIPITKRIAMGDLTQEQHDSWIKKENLDVEGFAYLQEYMCVDNIPIEGAVLEKWKREVYPGKDSDLNFFMSADIGLRDKYSILLWGIDRQSRLVLKDGIAFINTFTQDVVEETRKWLRKKGYRNKDGVMSIFLPHDAFRNVATSKYNDAFWWSQEFEVKRAVKHNKKEKAMMAMLNHLHRVYTVPILPDEIDTDLRNAQWDPKKDLVPLHNEFSHTLDSFRYGVTSIFENKNLYPQEDFEDIEMTPREIALARADRDYAPLINKRNPKAWVSTKKAWNRDKSSNLYHSY